MRLSETPDCAAIETAVNNLMKCLSILPGCCEFMNNPGEQDPVVAEETKAFYAKCPSVEKAQNNCMEDLSVRNELDLIKCDLVGYTACRILHVPEDYYVIHVFAIPACVFFFC